MGHDNSDEMTGEQDSKIHHTGGPDSDCTDSLIISEPVEPFGEGKQVTTTESVFLIEDEAGEPALFGGLFRPKEGEERPPDPILEPVEISAYIDCGGVSHEIGVVQMRTKAWDDDRNGWHVDFHPIPRAE